ncbi:MAG: flagellar filament capping protein FliD [Candidatus Eisenbacteria bacterium]|nr:flagellar filament capping protein FliD [Candidatus Eisenbacteria bacterium]
MATTSSVSSTSGGKFATQIEQLLQLERGPINKLIARRSQLDVTRGILSDIGKMLSDLRTAVDGLRGTGTLSPLLGFSVTNSNAQVVSATAAAGAARGTHQVTVTELAQSHMLGSGSFNKSATDFAAGDYAFDITVGGTTTRIQVTLGAGLSDDTALSTIAQAVNAAGIGASASVITTDAAAGTRRLVLQSTKTGVENLVANVADATGGLAAQLGIQGASTSSSYSAATIQQARDAAFNLDGLDLSSASNQVANVLSGVTLTLNAKSATPVSFTVAADGTATRKVVDDFITKYNAVLGYVRAKSAISDDGKTRGPLSGNSSFGSLRGDLRDITGGRVDGVSAGAPAGLYDLGIDAAQDGTLSVTDESKLAAALDANPAQVVAVFAGSNGVASRLYTLVDDFTSTGGRLRLETRALDDLSASLDARKAGLEDRLDRRRKQLVAQFARLQDLANSLADRQSQLSSLTGG